MSDKPGPGLHGYKAFYRGRQLEVYATSSLAALREANKTFKAKKEYDVTVVVCERPDGSTVTHTPDF